jgi:4-hydroxybenzoyl-CoA thioesterase
VNATTTYRVQVMYGDCGPDDCVLLHNYSRWMDAASQQHLRECGLPLWSRVAHAPGLLTAPVMDLQMRFVASATHGDVLQVRTWVEEWRSEALLLSHRVMRGDTLVCEGRETRALCAADATGRLKPLPVPTWMRPH